LCKIKILPTPPPPLGVYIGCFLSVGTRWGGGGGMKMEHGKRKVVKCKRKGQMIKDNGSLPELKTAKCFSKETANGLMLNIQYFKR
jgi:hypothetical protein